MDASFTDQQPLATKPEYGARGGDLKTPNVFDFLNVLACFREAYSISNYGKTMGLCPKMVPGGPGIMTDSFVRGSARQVK
jgi:hypothetical protein